jgi:hypothetical protein
VPAQHVPSTASQQTVSFLPMQPDSNSLQQTPRFGSVHFSPARQQVLPHAIWQHNPLSMSEHVSPGAQQLPPQLSMHWQVG